MSGRECSSAPGEYGEHMTEAWVQLTCPDCQKQWESNPSDLPAPGEAFECDHCGARRSVSEFMRTQRDFTILEQFHEP